MVPMVRYGVGVGLCLLVGCSETVDPNAIPAGPEQIAGAFTGPCVPTPLMDLPDAEHLRPFRPLMQQSLLRRLEKAHAVDQTIRTAALIATPPALQGQPVYLAGRGLYRL